MWRQLNAARFKKANPSLQIKTMVNSSPKAPFVNFTLHDDTQVRLSVGADALCICHKVIWDMVHPSLSSLFTHSK